MIYLDKVPTGQNYAIGCTAKTIRKYRNTNVYTTGYVEGQNQKGLQPQSLYDAQLAARHLGTGVAVAKQYEQPNVFAGTGRLFVESRMNGQACIYNLKGVLLQSFAVASNRMVGSDLLIPGLYVVNIQNEDRTTCSAKVYVR